MGVSLQLILYPLALFISHLLVLSWTTNICYVYAIWSFSLEEINTRWISNLKSISTE